MSDEVQKENAHIAGEADEFTSGGGRWRAAGLSSCGDLCGQVKGIHAAVRQSFMRILQEPAAVVGVEDHVGRDDDPLALSLIHI